jgi:Kiwa KwaB-like protein
MTLNFDLANVAATEFGVGIDEGADEAFRVIPVDSDVQGALREMALATHEEMKALNTEPPVYQPSEKHGGMEYVILPTTDELAEKLRLLHEANNLQMDSKAIEKTAEIFCYFARFTDKKGRRLTSLRRSTQFKGVLKSRLIRFMTDALRLIEDRVFKLDSDFDLLIDSTTVHILRPTAFEFAGKLQQAVLASASKNIAGIRKDLSYVDLKPIEKYAVKHPRAARLLASIHSLGGTKGVEQRLLERECKLMGVAVDTTGGKLTFPESEVLGFLEVLDRRRYHLELVKNSPERFRAASRTKLKSEDPKV